MKTLNALKLRIMTRAFRIRIANGEDFADIAADYPALTTDDLEAIREGHVSVTPLHLDLTHYPTIAGLRDALADFAAPDKQG